jgi:2,3-dihydroxy-p-cumate/2,3-dihydroxybenzoate 3,4-dioxygenase
VIKARLAERGIGFKEGSDLETDRVDRYIRFISPDGMELEVFHQMVEMPTAPPPSALNLQSLLHAGWLVADIETSAAFYHDVLGFRVSDWIEKRTAFMRCGDGYHHSLAIIEGEDSGHLGHVCLLAESIDDVMRARFNAVNNGETIGNEIMRHAPSGSVGVYIEDPYHSFTIEFCAGHRRFTPEESQAHMPRILPRIPSTSDMWKAIG